MNENDARALVVRTLRRIAPEADVERLDPSAEFRAELDIDSMDFLNFVIGLHEATGFDIPEADYERLETLGGCIVYLSEHVSAVSR